MQNQDAKPGHTWLAGPSASYRLLAVDPNRAGGSELLEAAPTRVLVPFRRTSSSRFNHGVQIRI